MARRRRRKGNPLLAKIMVGAVAAHAVALPVAAHFGAFKRLRQEFGTSRVVMVSLPPVEAAKPKAKEAKKAAPTVKKSAGTAPKATSAQKTGLPQPKVVASSGPATGEGGGPTVDANAAGKAGALPAGAGTAPPPSAVTPPPPSVEKRPEPPVPPPAVKPEPPPVVEKKPEAPPVVKARRIVEAVAVESPEPTIPDDLRSEPLDKTLVVEADVDVDGKPTNVRVAASTGIKELDAVGVDTAKRYRFRPATVDDAPTAQHVRFRILFMVE